MPSIKAAGEEEMEQPNSVHATGALREGDRSNATVFAIEKGVPLPKHGRAGELTIALRSMEVGDSFVMPVSRRSSISPTLARMAPKRFITRSVTKTEMRVWRVA